MPCVTDLHQTYLMDGLVALVERIEHNKVTDAVKFYRTHLMTKMMMMMVVATRLVKYTTTRDLSEPNHALCTNVCLLKHVFEIGISL